MFEFYYYFWILKFLIKQLFFCYFLVESSNISGAGNSSFFTTPTTTTTTTTPTTTIPYLYQQCPSYFTSTESITNFTHRNVSLIEPSLNNIIIGASGAFCCFAVAGIHHVVDSQDNLYHCEARTHSTLYNLTSSFYLFKNKILLLLLPTTLYLGMAQAFIYYKILKVSRNHLTFIGPTFILKLTNVTPYEKISIFLPFSNNVLFVPTL